MKKLLLIFCLGLTSCGDNINDSGIFVIHNKFEPAGSSYKHCYGVRDGSDGGFWFYTDEEFQVGDKLEITVKPK